MDVISSFFDDESGATAIEYALLASLIFVAIVSSTKDVAAFLTVIYLEIGAYMTTLPDPP